MSSPCTSHSSGYAVAKPSPALQLDHSDARAEAKGGKAIARLYTSPTLDRGGPPAEGKDKGRHAHAGRDGVALPSSAQRSTLELLLDEHAELSGDVDLNEPGCVDA